MLKRISLLAAALALTACATTNHVPSYEDSLEGQYSLSKEEQHVLNESDKLYKEIDQRGLILSDKATTELIKIITSRLLENHPAKGTIEFYVVKSPAINAFATGNRKVFIYSGIFSILENEDQLASLLAHEISHVTERHNLKSLINRKNTVASARIANFFVLGLATIPALSSLSQYSREHETEADIISAKMMVDAGFDPNATIALQENLKSVAGKKQQGREFFDSHPSSEERIERLRAEIEQLSEQINYLDTQDLLIANMDLSEHYRSVRLDRVEHNIKMQIRARQFQLALQGIEILAESNVQTAPGLLEFYNGEAYLGKSKYIEDAAKELSLIEYGNTKKSSQFKNDLVQNRSANLQLAKDSYLAAIKLDNTRTKGFIRLGEVAKLIGNKSEAIEWYERYRSVSTNERDIEYADRLISRLQDVKSNKE